MAMPNNVLSSIVEYTDFLPPKDIIPDNPTIAYEIGGIALRDSSQGLNVQIWTAEVIGDDVVIRTDTVPQTILFTRPRLTEISLTFDQNMNPFVAFVQDGQAQFWWYDSQAQAQVFSNLPQSCYTPRASLDDKRVRENVANDIILAYLRANTLYFRMERDRYTIEYQLQTGITQLLIQVGMNKKNRFQFLLGLFG